MSNLVPPDPEKLKSLYEIANDIFRQIPDRRHEKDIQGSVVLTDGSFSYITLPEKD
jgi:hypothetical protein